MNLRELEAACFSFEKPDKIPFSPGGPRESTRKRWYSEGLPEGADYFKEVIKILGIDYPEYKKYDIPSVSFKMMPTFEEKVLKHENGHYVVQDWMGAITEISDEYDYTYIRNAIDFVTRKWHKFPVENREDWEEMKKRFDVYTPGRIDKDIKTKGPECDKREYTAGLHFNGPFWQMREWMGMEGLCIAMVEQPDLVMEMAEFWKDFVTGVLKETLPYYVPDIVGISEDMAYKAHSMISPEMTRKFLQPSYLEWISLLNEYGCKFVDMDSDGYVADLIPIWIESGINISSPYEVAAHNDINEYRALYGNKMAFRGGIDKRCIAKGGEFIKAEIERITPVVKSGGYIPGCDHGVPHDISWPNFIEYCRLLAKVTGWL